MKNDLKKLRELSKLIRYWIISSTYQAGSGHPTSSLSAVELMVGLMFSGIFRYDLKNPEFPNNDRLIFSKGHASPLLYSLFAAAGAIEPRELLCLRKFGSRLEGHPTPKFPHVEIATGSLGQGLSAGLGMALNAKYLDKLPYRTFVLLGDGELAEGSNWEAIQLAAHYKLNNLIAILDVNRFGQSGETLYHHDLNAYQNRINSFGWQTITLDGHKLEKIIDSFKKALDQTQTPTMLIAKTLKGKGISFIEDKSDWHGKPLNKDQFILAEKELGKINKNLHADISLPENVLPPKAKKPVKKKLANFKPGEQVSTREAYGISISELAYQNPDIISLDADTKNSTYSEIFKKHHPERFFEMFIAEQNMVSTALGLSKRGKIPFVSTFASFLTRAHDQIRMSSFSEPNLKFVGSHSGVSIGEDGPSQMGIEDISMFRSLQDSIIFYPADAQSTRKLVEIAASKKGLFYIRTMRLKTPVIYKDQEQFKIGGHHLLKKSNSDQISIISAGITLHQTLAAYQFLLKDSIYVRVIDLYSIKPIEENSLSTSVLGTKAVITVEDHRPEGGLGEAVRTALSKLSIPIINLAVNKLAKSGTPSELLDYEEISSKAIIYKAKELLTLLG